tara:strand:- start:485 stop:736 length:252 start_codon:yes stop_codon:yes gene_type:complete
MSANYANANEVLPRELLGKLQSHHTGMLYIPPGKSKSMKNLVIGMLGQGASSREIEVITGLTRRRINQIRARYNASEGPRHAK